MIDSYFDVLIVGSGISGINCAYRIQESLPNAKFAILEARHELGGTWSQFRYPGVRSDSSMHTLGFQFNPWRAQNPIASGQSILTYLRDTAHKFDLDKKIRYRSKVVKANWTSEEQRWRLEMEVGNEVGKEVRRVVYWTKWLITGTGYYSYDEPLEAEIPGIESFHGKIVHPQFWPEGLDYKEKKVIVVGSGATTITLLPALVEGGVGSVTQLQRTPSYIMSLRQEDEVWFKKWAPEWFTLGYKRIKSALVALIFYKFCICFPTRASSFFIKQAAAQLPPDFSVDPHFKPPYNPWQQRICFCPDGDYFKAFSSGKAHIVTDTIKNVAADGIELSSGQKLDADIIVTATGLSMHFLGGIDVSVDGNKVDIASEYMWRNAMFTSLPNFGNIFGSLNSSWTLGSDAASHLFIRLMKYQEKHGYTRVVPVIDQEDRDKTVPAILLKSTYVTNAMRKMPHCADRGPWKPRDNWLADNWGMTMGSLNDGLKWERLAVE